MIHASLKEAGSLIDQGKGKPLQVNKYGSRASCPITTGSSRIFMNVVAIHSKIIIKEIQTKESKNSPKQRKQGVIVLDSVKSFN